MSATSSQPTYRYLSALEADAQPWSRFNLDGLVANEHGIELQSYPAVTGSTGAEVDVDLAGGIAVGPDGTLYISDPLGHQVLAVDPCDGTVTPLPCLSGPGWEPGQLRSPHGLIVGPRDALYIADSGNHRIVVVDLETTQLRDIWGTDDPWSEPSPSSQPGYFTNPVSLAVDSQHSIYVASPGLQDAVGVWTSGSLQKLDANGLPDLTFATTIAGQINAPAAVAVSTTSAGERLYVLDLQPIRLFVFDLTGTLDGDLTNRWQGIGSQLSSPNAVALFGDYLAVSDTRGINLFDASGTLISLIPITAAMAISLDGDLLALGNGTSEIRVIERSVAYREAGTFIAGPFDSDVGPVHWHEVIVEAGSLDDENHLQLYTAVTNSPVAPPPAPGNPWNAAPPDATQFLIQNSPGQYFWLAGELTGNGQSTPQIHQMHVSHSHQGYIQHLPAIYQEDEPSRAFLDQFLALFESLLANEEQLIDDLPLLFDALAAPDSPPDAAWLGWLSTWVDQPLDERWDGPTRRESVARAFKAHARRGTVDSLRQLIKLHTGATAHISEPARDISIWKLDSPQSVLGFSTRLATAEAEGAVLGSTAVLSESHLIEDGDDFGAPLFDDLAHCFTVQVYNAEFAGDATLDDVRAVIDREKPAHTSYQLCSIGAEMRIGMQSRISIDTIVGPTKPSFQLGVDHDLGIDTWLAGSFADTRVGGTIGRNTVIGERTQLT